MKKKIISWFRYQHFNTNCCKENHSHFIGCLNNLEYYSGKELVCESDTQENWKGILDAINLLSEEHLKKMEVKIHTRYK